MVPQIRLALLTPLWKKPMISDEVAVDTALEELSAMTANESEMLSNDQVVSVEVEKTNIAVTQIVGNIPFHYMGWMKV